MAGPLKIVLMISFIIMGAVFFAGSMTHKVIITIPARIGLVVAGVLLMIAAGLIATLEAHQP